MIEDRRGKHEYIYNLDDTLQNIKDTGFSLRTRVYGPMRILELYRNSDELFQGADKNIDDSEKSRIAQKIALIDQMKYEVLQKRYEASQEVVEQLKIVHYHIELAGIGLSIVDFKPSELAYISLKLLVISFQECEIVSEQYQSKFLDFHMILQNFQIDAMQNEIYPILLGPKEPFRQIEQDFIQNRTYDNYSQKKRKAIIKIDFVSTSSTDNNLHMDTFEDVNINLQELELKLHISLIQEINENIQAILSLIGDRDKVFKSGMFNQIQEVKFLLAGDQKAGKYEQQKAYVQLITKKTTQKEKKIKNEDYQPLLLGETYKDMRVKMKPPDFADLKCRKIYIKKLLISTVKITMTFRIRGIEQILGKSGFMYYILNFGSNFGDITEAEFTFSALQFSNVQKREVSMWEDLKNHYKQDAIQQFYQIFGSQDIIGNPSSFISNIGRVKDIQDIEYDDENVQPFQFFWNGGIGLIKNTALAFSNSTKGITGSLYLALKNAAGQKKNHNDLDRPLTFAGGLKKGILAVTTEVKDGIVGMVKIPYKKIQTQGFGGAQLSKGMAQGFLNSLFSIPNSMLRGVYCVASGITNEINDVKDFGQRARYPRYFDLNEKMLVYNSDFSQAQLALKNYKEGMYKNEVIETVYDVSYRKNNEFFTRVLFITNESVMFMEKARKLKSRVLLRKIKGMMVYFSDQLQNQIVLELQDNSVEIMDTKNPLINELFLADLKKKLQQLAKQQNQVNRSKSHSQPNKSSSQRMRDPVAEFQRENDYKYGTCEQTEIDVEVVEPIEEKEFQRGFLKLLD